MHCDSQGDLCHALRSLWPDRAIEECLDLDMKSSLERHKEAYVEVLGKVPDAWHFKRLYHVLPCWAKAEGADAARIAARGTP